MRKLQDRARTRLIGAGLTAAATAAAVVTMAPAAFATDVASTLTPNTGGLNGTLVLAGTNVFSSGPSPVGYFISSGSCGVTYATNTPPATVATINRSGNDGGTVTLGTGAAALSFTAGASTSSANTASTRSQSPLAP